MKRFFVAVLLVFVGIAFFASHSTHALSSNPKLFISADNTFYAYVKSGETIGATFSRIDLTEQFDTTQEAVTITLDGPGAQQQKCVAPKNVAVGQGCRFAAQTASQSGIWRIQFTVPAPAKPYEEVSPVVKWGKNMFEWDITVNSGTKEQKGRIWTEQYAIRQPPAASFSSDLTNYFISEDGYLYRAVYKGYNGQISILSADGIGIRSGKDCVSAYQSVEVGNTKLSPALGTCGNAYKMFLEEPAGDLPAKAVEWDKAEDWVRPNISRPSISELHFNSDKSTDQQSGTISFYLRNFIGQYKIKIDVENDGEFDGQNDVVLNQQMKKISGGLQSVRFDGTDKTGQIIPPSQKIGVKVEITKAAEIHFVASDVEGRSEGFEVTRLNGENAPTTRLCWNDTELTELASDLTTEKVDGRSCPDSTGGVHGWTYADGSWGNARYIDDWTYAQAKLVGSNQIVYPEDVAVATDTASKGYMQVAVIAGTVLVALIGTVAVLVLRRKKMASMPHQLPPQPPAPGDPSNSN